MKRRVRRRCSKDAHYRFNRAPNSDLQKRDLTGDETSSIHGRRDEVTKEELAKDGGSRDNIALLQSLKCSVTIPKTKQRKASNDSRILQSK